MQSVLLLQGPLGPFFKHLSHFLHNKGMQVHKINFNLGDNCWRSKGNSSYYRGSLADWQHYLADYIAAHQIDTVFCYSDCREYHAIARQFCLANNIRFFVFEEGYLRPHYVTLEQDGVNAHSSLYGQLPNLLVNASSEHIKHSLDIKPNFKRRIYYAIRYYANMQFSKPWFQQYAHHRPRPYWQEATAWLKGWYTKHTRRRPDAQLQKRLIQQHSGHIHLVPLQVADDYQIRTHSDFPDVSAAVQYILDSFAKHSSASDVLVFKHHPMDRGYTNYTQLINAQAAKLGIKHRVFYGFELSLPDLYKHCKGVVTVNSTVGLSALFHHVPTITLGKALYDVPGLTSQCTLNEFWQAPEPVDTTLFKQFRAFLLARTQINGSFYTQHAQTCHHVWQHLLQYATPSIAQKKLLQPIAQPNSLAPNRNKVA